jgi:predicted nucleic acid-binding protein
MNVVVVADTGPLLHLHEIDAAHLLGHFGTIHVTPTVLTELERHAPGCFGNMPDWWVPSAPSSAAQELGSRWIDSGLLDSGEAEALAFAQEIHADCFITDDSAARTLGESLGIQVRGTLGIVIHAAATGQMDRAEAESKLSDLEHRSTLWMSARVRHAALQALFQIYGQP